MNSYAFNLDIDKRFSEQVVVIGQSDHNGTDMTVTLYEDGTRLTTAGLTAYFAMRLPNGTDYYRKACTYNAGVITCTIDEEYAGAAAGKTDVAYFELHQGSSVIASTARFLVIVLPSATAGMSEGQRYDDEIAATVRAWLVEHPEATTTVQDNSITTVKLKDGIVTSAKIADGGVATVDLADSSVTTPKIADSAVTTAKVANGAVTSDKVADGSVLTAKLADGAATTQKLADGSVTNDKLGASAVTGEKIANNTIPYAKLTGFTEVTESQIHDMVWG